MTEQLHSIITIDDHDYGIPTEEAWMIAESDISAIAQVGFGLLHLRSTEGDVVVLLNHGSTLKYRRVEQ
jgi:hypothetical protein